MAFEEIAAENDIPESGMKHVDAGGTELLLVNAGGKIYALEDRCGHMNAPLSRGTLRGNIVECPLHHAQFDVRTGRPVRGPKIPTVLKLTSAGKMMAAVKTHRRRTFPVRVTGGKIEVDLG
jgi:nitrite reductase/ring-hydroxylating ferredoxin subunit